MLDLAQPPVREALVGLSLLAASAAPDPFATEVVDYAPGPGLGVFVADLCLGEPQGAGLNMGSLHVTSLGVGGSLTLGFDVALVDGPGADLTVFENAFFDLAFGGVYAEGAFVEVSTDGATFARFPARYAGPAGPLSPFGTTPIGTFSGLAGTRPVLALPEGPSALDPSASGGDAFDLADLRRTPEVLTGAVRLDDVRFVRLVDVVDGDLGADGLPIWDHSGAGGSADIDAVALLNHAENQHASRPAVELSLDAAGNLHLEIADADGLADVVSLEASVAFVPVDLFTFLASFTLVQSDTTRMHLVLEHAVAGSGVTTDLTVTVRDAAGRTSSDQVTLQG